MLVKPGDAPPSCAPQWAWSLVSETKVCCLLDKMGKHLEENQISNSSKCENLSFYGSLLIIFSQQKSMSMQHLGIFLPLADIVRMKSQLIQSTVSFNAACMTQEVGSWLSALARKFGPETESNLLMLDVVDKDVLVWIIALAMQFSQSKQIACKKASLEECIAHLRAEIELWKILDTYSHFCDEITILNQQSQGILRLKFSSVPEVRSNLFLPFSFRDNYHRISNIWTLLLMQLLQ